MNTFQLKHGVHIEDGVVHKEGATFVSHRNLISLFPTKFVDLGPVVMPLAPPVVVFNKPLIPVREPVEEPKAVIPSELDPAPISPLKPKKKKPVVSEDDWKDPVPST